MGWSRRKVRFPIESVVHDERVVPCSVRPRILVGLANILRKVNPVTEHGARISPAQARVEAALHDLVQTHLRR